MTDVSKQKNRISAEEVEQQGSVISWTLPRINKSGKIVKSAKREQKDNEKNSGIVIEDYKGTVKPKPLTAEQLQQMADEAQKEGYDTGYREGLERGLTEGTTKGEKEGQARAYNERKKELVDHSERLSAIARNLLIPMQEQDQHLENVILEMATRFAEAIVKTEIKHSPPILQKLVHQVLDSLPVGAKNISVYLNQNDSELINRYLPPENRDWDIKVDESLTAGGCRVETDQSFIDFSIDNRLKSFIDEVQKQEISGQDEYSSDEKHR